MKRLIIIHDADFPADVPRHGISAWPRTVRVSGTQGPLDTAAGSPGDACASVDFPATGQAPMLEHRDRQAA